MPFPLWAIPAGISLLQTAYGASQKKKNKPKLFENTFEGRRLAQMSNTGYLNPAKMGALNTLMATQTGGATNVAKSNILGSQIRGGMENSISASQPYTELDTEQMRTLADKGTNLWMLNEMSKERAADMLAQGKDESRTEKRAWRDDSNQTLSGGLGQAAQLGLQGYGKYAQNQEMQTFEDEINALMDSGDPEALNKAYMKLMAWQPTDYGWGGR